MQCGNCKFWDEDLERIKRKGDGICHRYPPAMEGNDNRYPVTDMFEWCGEFKEIKPGAQE